MTEPLTPGIVKKLKALSNVEPTGIINAPANFSEGRMEEKGELDHYIGVATSSDETAQFDVLNVEAGWFPSSGYEAVPVLEILWNESQNTDDPNYRSEI